MTDFPDHFPYICCQCGRKYGQAAIPNSHGYCPVCYKKALAEIKQRHVAKLRYFVRLCKRHNWSYPYADPPLIISSEWEKGFKESTEIYHLQKSLDIDAQTHRIIECALNKYSPWRKIRNKMKKKG